MAVIENNIRYRLFQISWLLLIIGTVCDLAISDNFSFGFFTFNIQLSSIVIIIYLICFITIFPLKEISRVFKSRYNAINLVLLSILLIIAYISSYFSLMSKYALISTTSRYTLYFLALVVTLSYSLYFIKANDFIIRSFVYLNFFIAVSSLAEYYIPAFYQVLIKYFGVMEAKNALMRIGGVEYMRPSGFITDSNLTAFTLALSSHFLLLNRQKFNKYFEFSFYAIAGICVGLLASRTALLVILFLLAAVLIFKQVKWKYAGIYFILFVIIQIIAPQTQARFFNIMDRGKRIEEMEKGRPLIWQGAYLAMKVKPVLGLGTGIFFKQSDVYISRYKNEINDQQYYAMLSDPDHKNYEGINPHNIFFTLQIEHGIIAAAIFVILILYNIYYFIKTKKFNSLAAALSILFVSTLSNYAPYYKYYLLLVIIFYITISINSKLSGEISKN